MPRRATTSLDEVHRHRALQAVVCRRSRQAAWRARCGLREPRGAIRAAAQPLKGLGVGSLSLILQPKLFREIFLPRYRQFCEFVKGRAPVKVALHSCGPVCWALDDLANAGIDIVQPG